MNIQSRSIRVLVVDDDHTVADTLVLILRARGFESRAVYSGPEAAELCLSWRPHAVIADVVMEPMDGVELALFLAKRLPACRVLLVSGYGGIEQRMNETKRRGHQFSFLAKPFQPEAVLEFLGSPSIVDMHMVA